MEVPSYPFVGAADLAALGITEDDPRHWLVRLANPLSDEQPFLRTTLLPGLVATARRNLSRGTDDLALFEQGLVFHPRARFAGTAVPRPQVDARPDDAELAALEDLLPDQPRHVAVILSGAREAGRLVGRGPPGHVGRRDRRRPTRGRGPSASTSRSSPASSAPWHPGRCAVLRVAGSVVGHAGELHPKVLEGLGLPERTAAMEVDLDALTGARLAITPAPTVGTMPVAKEDVALIVAADVPAAAVAAALRTGGGDLLESVRLFDEYRGSQVGDGYKSLAFSLRFRAPDRTLTADEVAAARGAAVAAAAAEFDASLRG